MLNEMAKEIHENAVAHGWWEAERKIPEILMLCVSELSEALEEYRSCKPAEYVVCKEDGSPCELVSCLYNGEVENDCRQSKTEGIAVEMADCIIRILDWCGKEGIDIDSVITRKMEYNKTRPYKHGGKVC